MGGIDFQNLDGKILIYTQSLPPLSQRSSLEKLICAFKHYFPDLAGNLPRSARFAKQLKRQYRGVSKPPMIWDVLVLIMVQLIGLKFPTTALAALLQFDCFLRPGELCGILSKHVAFPGGGLLGSQARKVLILLPTTKTGPLQSVRVESQLVQKLLVRLVDGLPNDSRLFLSYKIYSSRIAKALDLLGLTHIGYTPHSIRHGAATMALINKGERAIPEIMARGRWESGAGRTYLQMGAASLLYAEIPSSFVKVAKQQEEALPFIFRNVTLFPTL